VVAELNRRDAKPSVKRACCEILGRIRDPHKDAVAALIEKLKDPDEYGESVAASAARALGAIGDESAAGPLLEVLKGRAVDVDKVLKVEAIRSLGILRSAASVELLRKALDDKKTASVAENDDVAPLVAAAAADALGAIRAKEATDDLGAKLADTTTNPSSTQQLGVHAARALQRILAAELANKTEKDDARAGSLTGSQDEVTKTLEAWRKWWDGLKAKKDIEKTKADLVKVGAAVEAFRKAQGKLPEILDYLKNKPDYAKDWPKDGYYAGDLKDAWGRAFQFRVPGTGADFDVFSWGGDMRAWGTGDAADLYHHDKWIAAVREKTQKTIEETAKLIQQFKTDQDFYPQKLVDLVSKPPPPPPLKKWDKPYAPEVPKDGFGVELKYKNPGTEGEPFDLISLGADNKEGGEGPDEDVWNHAKRPKKEEPKKPDGK
jgi:type II secretion system protein G